MTHCSPQCPAPHPARHVVTDGRYMCGHTCRGVGPRPWVGNHGPLRKGTLVTVGSPPISTQSPSREQPPAALLRESAS